MLRRLCLTALLASIAAVPVQAAVLYGIDVPGNLFRVNLATGAGTLVGTLPAGPFAEIDRPGYNEIEYDVANGRAWAQQRNANFALQEFDIGNGAGIGGPISNGASWHGLEFVGSTLYAAGFSGVVSSPSLVTLNPATGASSLIGPTGTGNPLTGLAYDTGAGIMYGIDGGAVSPSSTLYTINLSTGLATQIGLTGITAGSLEFGPDGNLYAGGVADNAGNLYQISATNAASTLIGATGFGVGVGNGISGLALVPIPAALPLLGSALGLMAFLGWKRRSAA